MIGNDSGIKKNNLISKFIIVFILIVAVIAVWLIKNNFTTEDIPQVSDNEETVNPDFNLEITDTLDIDKLKSYGLPIIIEFGSDSCPACRVMAPIIEELNSELSGRAIIRYADIWAHPSLADGYPLTVIPTQLFIDALGNPYNPVDPEMYALDIYQNKDTGAHLFTMHEGILEKEDLMIILDEMGMK